MSSSVPATKRRRRLWLASTILAPIVSLGISAAHAQQSASPNLLPPVDVEAPPDKSKPRSTPAPNRAAESRRAVPTTQQAPADAQQAGTSGKDQTLVVSPTGTVTPIDQIASSVTVITAKDIERDQRRTAAGCAVHRSRTQRRPKRRAGRANLDLHARHQLKPHQGPDRRHRCQRSQQPQPYLRHWPNAYIGYSADRGAARPAKRTLRRRRTWRRDFDHHQEGRRPAARDGLNRRRLVRNLQSDCGSQRCAGSDQLLPSTSRISAPRTCR